MSTPTPPHVPAETLHDHEGAFGEVERAVEQAAVAPVVVDPTRFGDWEKNGRCIDF
jgi:hypothetical protein